MSSSGKEGIGSRDQPPPTIGVLSNETLDRVFQFLDYTDYQSCALTCDWFHAVLTRRIYRSKVLSVNPLIHGPWPGKWPSGYGAFVRHAASVRELELLYSNSVNPTNDTEKRLMYKVMALPDTYNAVVHKRNILNFLKPFEFLEKLDLEEWNIPNLGIFFDVVKRQLETKLSLTCLTLSPCLDIVYDYTEMERQVWEPQAIKSLFAFSSSVYETSHSIFFPAKIISSALQPLPLRTSLHVYTVAMDKTPTLEPVQQSRPSSRREFGGVPVEVATSIIEYLDRDTAKALSLTCRSLRQLAIPEVFRHVSTDGNRLFLDPYLYRMYRKHLEYTRGITLTIRKCCLEEIGADTTTTDSDKLRSLIWWLQPFNNIRCFKLRSCDNTRWYTYLQVITWALKSLPCLKDLGLVVNAPEKSHVYFTRALALCELFISRPPTTVCQLETLELSFPGAYVDTPTLALSPFTLKILEFLNGFPKAMATTKTLKLSMGDTLHREYQAAAQLDPQVRSQLFLRLPMLETLILDCADLLMDKFMVPVSADTLRRVRHIFVPFSWRLGITPQRIKDQFPGVTELSTPIPDLPITSFERSDRLSRAEGLVWWRRKARKFCYETPQIQTVNVCEKLDTIDLGGPKLVPLERWSISRSPGGYAMMALEQRNWIDESEGLDSEGDWAENDEDEGPVGVELADPCDNTLDTPRLLKMEKGSNVASARRRPSTALQYLPTELVLQILKHGELTDRDRAAFAATCRRFKEIAYPLLYRKFDWVAPFQSTSLLERWVGQLGLLIEFLLEPLVSALFTMFGNGKILDKKCIAFERKARLVREMSVLGGYQYYKDCGVLIRYYGPRDHGDSFVNLFHPFGGLVRIELDERAALTWHGYLRVVANILVTKPRLKSLTLRHRLGLQPTDKTTADMVPIMEILASNGGVVTRLKTLSVILGRRFEASEMGYEHFVQLMELLASAVKDVTTFEVFANYSKLDENDTVLRGESVKPWVMPKLQAAQLHVHGFPTVCPVRSIVGESIAGVRKLKVVCDIVKADLGLVGENLSAFEALEELEIWDPMWATDWEYTEEELRPFCAKLSILKEFLPKLRVLRWTLGQQNGIICCVFSFEANDPRNVLSIRRSQDVLPREKVAESLPDRLRYIKQGYILAGAATGAPLVQHRVY
ncbi:hypothetical protein Dda_2218 [Drechslerella dactyloides]|uniref:F-box domain-containing protein n=1 Tax=Drechslerella dactyloides TaxID=74499 RepID=A0AAD6NMT8_DREDA|nr:hypothetical protein Dda_2218 [Drechslerella dactyloides]